MIVDAHQHFWRINDGVHGWIDDTLWELHRDYLPQHLAPYLRHLGIDKTILVQASETLSDNTFLLEQAAATDWVGGIVAWVDLTSPTVRDDLDTLAQHPIVKGIRPVLQGIEDSAWILRADVLAALRHLPELALRFDALIQPRHLPAIMELCEKIPDLDIVIDHGAKPVICNGQTPSSEWCDGIAALAQNPKVHCKASGLATEYGAGWSGEKLRPVYAHLLDTFGPDRLMWGSDWPVLERHGSYAQWFAAARELIDPTAREQIFGQTAARFYGL